MKEIPIAYVRANQFGMAAFIVLSILLQQPLLIAVVWVIEAAGLLIGAKANVFIAVIKPFVRHRLASSLMEAVELQRFNNSIALSLLSLSVIFLFGFHWLVAGYIFAGMVALAAICAILGYCIGCTLYYQFKQWKLRRNLASRQG